MLLQNWLAQLQQRFAPAPRRFLRRHHPGMLAGIQVAKVQTLEERTLLSATPVGTEYRVNTFTTGDQDTSFDSPRSVAMDEMGNYVVAWRSQGQDGGAAGVYAQRFDACGVAQGSEFRVNTQTANMQNYATVAMDEEGDFVITWTGHGQDGSGTGIYAQRYNSNGEAQGGEFRVNTYTTDNQWRSSVAMDADGDFVVTWKSFGQDGSDLGIYAQRYNATGVAQGGEFRVNSHTANIQNYPDVAMDADGDFVITWSSLHQDGDWYGIYGQRYNAAGVAQGGEFRINSHTTGYQWISTVAMDADGDFVSAWFGGGPEGIGVYARRYSADGAAEGIEFRVNGLLDGGGYPVVAANSGGDFVITWSSYASGEAQRDVFARRYGATGESQEGAFRVNTFTQSYQESPAVAMDPSGDFTVVWTNRFPLGSTYYSYSNWEKDVHSQRYNASAPNVLNVLALGDPVGENEQLLSAPQSVTVVFSENMEAQGAGGVTNPANWGFTKNGLDVGDQILSITFGQNAATNCYEAVINFAAPLTTGDYVLTAKESLTDLQGRQLDGDNNYIDGGDFARAFRVRKIAGVGNEFRVNAATAGNQRTDAESPQSVALDANGNFVITWSSNGQDGSGYGIYAQRYDSSGVATGNEFRVNTYTTNIQRNSTVAMDADGDFVITWSSNGQDGGGYGVYAQRYNAAGVAQGSEFRVNTYTTNAQRNSTVAMDADGDFVITWSSNDQDGNGYGIYAQKYTAAGVAQGSEFRVNTHTTNHQQYSSVSMDGDGDFVITWSSSGQSGNGDEIFAQRYNAAGVAQGSEFRVNTHTTNHQQYSSVSMDDDGDFVITWSSSAQDNSGYGVFAQRYTSAGVAQGTEFRVNSATNNAQRYSTVAMDADGDFVVAWNSNVQDGSSYGIYAQRYNAAGVAQGNEFRSNTYTTNAQRASTVAINSDGDFVIAWRSSGQDGNGYGVYAQRFEGVTDNTAPQIALRNQVTTLAENTSTASGMKVADIDIDDDDIGLNLIGLTGPQLSFFELVGRELRLKAGVSLNFEATPSLSITVHVNDEFIGSGIEDSQAFTLSLTNVNEAPTNLTVTPVTVAENQVVGTTVGTFATVDPDAGNSFSYSLVAGTGDADNSSFTISGSLLKTNAVFNFEAKSSYSVRVRTIDQGGLSFDKVFTIVVLNVNEGPTSLVVTPATVAENQPAGTTVGTLTTADPDAGNTFTYSLVSGTGSTDNANFAIAGNLLKTTAVLNFEVKSSYSIRVRTMDQGGLFTEVVLTITVVDVNETPVIAAFDTAVSYTENAIPVLLDADVMIEDPDSSGLSMGALQVALTSNSESTDRVGIQNVGTLAGQIGVSGTTVSFGGLNIGTYSGTTTLVVALNASATPAGVQALLRNVTFSSVSENPSTLSRTVTVTLTDGDGGTSNVPSKTISLVAVNDAPVIGGFDTAVSYTANSAAILVDSNATVSDVDSANFSGGKLTFSLTLNAQTTDQFGIRHQGLTSGLIGVSGANVTFGGVLIGTKTGGTGTSPLVIIFNASATAAAVQALLRNVTWQSTASVPSTLPRTVSVSLSDGDGGVSGLLTKQINVLL